MPSVNASGSQACTITTEHTLATVTTPNNYALVLDLSPLASGDTLEVRIYDKVLSGSTSRVLYKETFVGVQADPNAVSIPVPTTHEIKVSLKQTAGTGRTVDWSLRQL